ncbi:MAG TPA: hypothetical protein VFA52_02825 [Candidatus Paceibacterota bacterium]|nr:hypothetical protein [Candidatus Paceibacterota bacterium]
MVTNTWGDVLVASFTNLWYGIVSFIPNIIIAIVIFVIGWLIGVFIDKLVREAFRAMKIDNALRSAGVENTLNRGGILLNSGAFVGGLIKWFIIVVFLLASFEVLGLTQVTDFLKNVVLNYLPQVIVAVLILLVAVVIAQAVQRIVSASAKAARLSHANLLGSIAKWAIWIFAILTALVQLGIAVSLIQTLFMGVVVALSLAFGLAFGLGGQDAAARYIDKVRNEISDRNNGMGA